MQVDVLLGMQWGDEGKGKIVDVFTPKYDIIARFQGGPNAGHTLEFDGQKHVLHTIPSGIFHDGKINVIGNGVVIDPVILRTELQKLANQNVPYRDRLFISRKAHLILPTHRALDAASEASKGDAKIGSTLKGIGPTYMDKTGRNGLRVGDTETVDFKKRYMALRDKHLLMLERMQFEVENLEQMETDWFEAIDFIRQVEFIESEYYLNEAMRQNKSILAEGAQGSLLDIEFGSYPYVTSSNTICAGACIGLGIAPKYIGEVYGIFKAYCTRVGSGPFPTELNDETGKKLRDIGNEYGSTTGRPRRCGWLDLVALKYAVMLNGVSQLIMTKADVLNDFEQIKVCTQYHVDGELTDRIPFNQNGASISPQYIELPGWNCALSTAESLPHNLDAFVKKVEAHCGVPITTISLGPDRSQTIIREEQSV